MAGPIPIARTSARASARAAVDACPGALRPHHAADGELVRLRLPGGAVSASQLAAVQAASAAFGDGRLGLTSRGNLQLRGISADAVEDVAGWVRGAGLLPSLTHERVRNIIASPLSGRLASSRACVDALAADLDAALCLRPGLADLPGRFLFAVDDGTGDVAGLGADVVLQVVGDGLIAVQLPGGSRVLVPEEAAVPAALAVAEAFQAEAAASPAPVWRLTDLPPEARARLRRGLSDHGEMVVGEAVLGAENDQNAALSVGLVEQVDGRLTLWALAPLGVLEGEQVAAVVAAAGLSSGAAGVALRMTPWRRVVVRDLEVAAGLAARELLAAYGLVVDAGTAWSRVTACTGRPGCAKALADVHSDALAFVADAGTVAEGAAIHWAGCERGCGTPSGPVAVAIATGQGYSVTNGELLGAAERAWVGAR